MGTETRSGWSDNWEQPGQDGCEYSAVDIYTTEARKPVEPPESPPGAYSSSLTIEFDPQAPS